MKNSHIYIISRYNHDMASIMPYIGTDYVLYDRSEKPIEGSIVVPNIGSDIYDKFTYIIDNYDNLPDVMTLIKANLFKYISEEEFIKVKDNKILTPLLTKSHKVDGHVNFYSEDGIYNEINDYWYLQHHKCKHLNTADELKKILGFEGKQYLKFSPGSNYIVTKEVVHKHPKEFYVKLRSYLEWAVYPGEAQLIERGLFYLWS